MQHSQEYSNKTAFCGLTVTLKFYINCTCQLRAGSKYAVNTFIFENYISIKKIFKTSIGHVNMSKVNQY